MKKLKKRAGIPVIMLIFSLLLTGCDIEFTSGFDGLMGGTAKTQAEETIPTGSYPTIRSSTIKIDNKTSITLPETYHYATHEINMENGTYTVWYGFEKDVNYISPNDEDIMFYVFKGNDLKTPATELKVSEANTSLATYIKYFVAEADKRSNPVITANGSLIDINGDDYKNEKYWVYPFYMYENREAITTTYNETLYPKYFYGVCILDRDADNKPSRDWYMFIFSNDATGKLIGEEDYTRIFEQEIKGQFGLSIFPTQFTEKEVEQRETAGIAYTDPLFVAPEGYDYEQFLELFEGTTSYYRVLPNVTVKPESTAQTPTETETETPEPVTERRYTGLYAVLDVIDGDTIDVDVDGEIKRIRLIGIDTPESVNPDETLNTPEGEEASKHMKELLAEYNNFVYLEWGEGTSEDSYGRTLAYAYVTDGTKITMLNRMLIEQGYARVMTVEPDSRYVIDFEREEKRAQKAEAGFWGTGFFTIEPEDGGK